MDEIAEHLSSGVDACFANAGWGRTDAFIDMPVDTFTDYGKRGRVEWKLRSECVRL